VDVFTVIVEHSGGPARAQEQAEDPLYQRQRRPIRRAAAGRFLVAVSL
jgi:hypothetical protein